jgi:hypothetical protein
VIDRSPRCCGCRLSAADRVPRLRVTPETESLGAYSAGREPVMRMSTSLLALCSQSGLVATYARRLAALAMWSSSAMVSGDIP